VCNELTKQPFNCHKGVVVIDEQILPISNLKQEYHLNTTMLTITKQQRGSRHTHCNK